MSGAPSRAGAALRLVALELWYSGLAPDSGGQFVAGSGFLRDESNSSACFWVVALSGVCKAGVEGPAFSGQAGIPLSSPPRIEGRELPGWRPCFYRPDDAGPAPLGGFSATGRNGPQSVARPPNTVFSVYGELCRALAAQGHVVAYFVRRGFMATRRGRTPSCRTPPC